MTTVQLLKLFLLIVVVQTAIDATWIFYIMRDFYTLHFSAVAGNNALQTMRPIAGGLVWMLMAVGLLQVIIPQLSFGLAQTVLHGALYGFVVFGVYELTNYAIFTQWPLVLVGVDMAWGVTLNVILSTVCYYAMRYII